jgi:transposase-like protein
MRTAHRSRRSIPPRSTFAGFRFPSGVSVLAVRWYLRFGLSYRHLKELLTERGVEVDHVPIYRWVLRFTPLLADAAPPFGQVIDVFVSPQRDTKAAQRFFERGIETTRIAPTEVTTDPGAGLPYRAGELLPAALHRTDRYANNRAECDHGRLKPRLRPMRGLKQDRSAR